MTTGYFCDKCKKPFKGKPALELDCNLEGPIEKVFESDGETSEFCKACGTVIFKSIPWSRDD